jgi:hypothetical protein
MTAAETNIAGTPVAPVLINNAGAVGAQALGTSYTDQRYPLLSKHTGNNGGEFLYVYASSSVAQYLAVLIQPTGKVVASTNALSTLGAIPVGFTDQGPLQAASYGFVTISGLTAVKVRKGTYKNKPLFTSLSAGYLSTTSTVLASANAPRSSPHVFGVWAVIPSSGNGSVGCTATDSGDVRPMFVSNCAMIDKTLTISWAAT